MRNKRWAIALLLAMALSAPAQAGALRFAGKQTAKAAKGAGKTVARACLAAGGRAYVAAKRVIW